MTSREQFEAWLRNTYEWANDTLDMAFFYGDDETGYYIGGDFIYDGHSCSDALFWAWRGWQASREAVEVELPSLKQIDSGERYVWSDGVFNFKEDVIESLIATGIKVKGE